MLSKSELIDQLQTGVYAVTFTKVNGEKRKLHGTLMSDILGDITLSTTEQIESREDTIPDDLDRISVWCPDISAWRAFKPSKLISFERLQTAPEQMV